MKLNPCSMFSSSFHLLYALICAFLCNLSPRNFNWTFLLISETLELGTLELEDLEDLCLNHHLHFLQDQVTLEQETKTYVAVSLVYE